MNGFDSVDEIINWYDKKGESVEAANIEITANPPLKWDYTDVLYSFKGVYTIGAYCFYPQDFKRTEGGLISAKGSDYRKTYSGKYIKENYGKYKDLNECTELKEFLKRYKSIGNVIPIWPGGNSNRGQSYCYDLPDVYFCRNRVWLEKLSEVYLGVNLDILSAKYKKMNVGELIDDLVKPGKYQEYLKYIVGIIDDREKKILSLCQH